MTWKQKKIQFEFINTVLSKNENVVYFTQDKPNIIDEQIYNYGIDSNDCVSKNLLHIIQIPDFLKAPEGPQKSIEKTMTQILTKLKSPYHILGRFFPDLTRDGALEAEVNAEQTFQSTFVNFKGSFLCDYSMDEIKKTHGKEKNKILRSHHKIIFAETLENAICFDP